jgi:hypothetical protein
VIAVALQQGGRRARGGQDEPSLRRDRDTAVEEDHGREGEEVDLRDRVVHARDWRCVCVEGLKPVGHRVLNDRVDLSDEVDGRMVDQRLNSGKVET